MDGMDRILRIREVTALTGICRTTVYAWGKRGLFPSRVDLGGGRVGWRESEVRQWIADRAVKVA